MSGRHRSTFEQGAPGSLQDAAMSGEHRELDLGLPNDLPLYKPCTKCREPKPLSRFALQAKSADGLASQCKDCSAKDPIT